MKKAFLIFFVLVAAIGACFAATGDVIHLTTKIAEVVPNFKMYSGETLAKPAADNVSIGVPNPAEQNVELPISIHHVGSSVVDGVASDVNYIRSASKYKLTITASALAMAGTDQTTDVPGVSDFKGKTKADYYTISDNSGTNNVVVFTVDYDGEKTDTGEIATWKYTWTQKESLAAGTYTGTIKLEFETTT